MPKVNCSLCGEAVDNRRIVNPQKIEDRLVDIIHKDHPQWDGKRGVCPKCMEQYRAKKFLSYLEEEYQKLNEMETNLVSKIAQRGRVSKAVNDEFEEKLTFGNRIADKVAKFGGSWTFIIFFGGFMLFWMVINSIILASRPFDVYPYILLNLMLSALAALQAPVIMMSQNRQADKDRLQAQNDYEINLMAEMEIRDLHDKLDSLRYKQWHELWQMQKRQLEVLELLEKALHPPGEPATEGTEATEN